MPPHLDPELLSAYLDEEVSEAERAVVEAHLPGCTVCQQEMAILRATVNLLERLPDVPLPRTFYVTEAMLAPAPRTRAGRAWLRWFTPAAAALAALLVLAVVVRGPLGGQSGTMSSDSAAREAAPVAASDVVDDAAMAEASTEITVSEVAGIQADEDEALPAGDALPEVAMEAPPAATSPPAPASAAASAAEPQASPEPVPSDPAPAPAPDPGAYRWLALALLTTLLITSLLLWRRSQR